MTDRIYLTGYRGTGKTTVGRLISSQLSTECVDLDQRIEAAAGQAIKDIFAQGGEQTFRDWESRCLRETAEDASAGRVISLGGGAILRQENREIIRQTGVCIWLTALPATIAQRILNDSTSDSRRPALTDLSATREIEQLLAQREPLYRQSAGIAVATDDKSPAELAGEILSWLAETGQIQR
jgi:shikimate kinase